MKRVPSSLNYAHSFDLVFELNTGLFMNFMLPT